MENEISYRAIGAALSVHSALGAGLLESVYEEALFSDLQDIGYSVQRQIGLPFHYKNLKFDKGYRIDLLIENKVILEIRSVEKLAPVHFAQTLTYLKLSNKKLALLINFNTPSLKQGIHRLVNKL